MNSEKQLYQSVPSSDSFRSDHEDQSECPAPSRGYYTTARGALWSIAQIALVLVIIGQTVAIVILSRTSQSSCQSARESFLSQDRDYTIS